MARAAALHLYAVAALVAVLVLLLGPRGEVAVPARDGVHSVLWPLVPVLPAAVIPMVVGRVRADQWRLSVRPPWSRHVPVLLALMVSGAVLVLVAGAAELDPWVLARNVIFLDGIAVLAALTLGASLNWLPAVLAAAVMWLFGTVFGGGARPWALLLQPAEHRVASGLAGLTALVAVVVAVLVAVRPTLSGRRRPGSSLRRRRWPRRASRASASGR